MAVPRRLGQVRPVVSVLVLFAMSLVLLDRIGPDTPTQALRSGGRDAFASLGDSASALWPFSDTDQVKALKAENARLVDELQQVRAQGQQAADAARQRDNLLSLLALPTPNNVDKVIAPVIAIDSTNFDNTVELGKGRRHGIEPGMPVVNPQGLVGRVIGVSESRSSVLLITDSTSNVGVRVGATGDVGVAVGSGQNSPLRIDLIEADSPVALGDVAVTNGMPGSVFPPGIVVGTVASSRVANMDLRRDVTARVAADLNRLDNVAVLQWRSTP